MYSRASVGGAGAAIGGLAATGMNVIWLVLAAFALLGAGLALLRILPRREA